MFTPHLPPSTDTGSREHEDAVLMPEGAAPEN
jgi:hypothetical protein